MADEKSEERGFTIIDRRGDPGEESKPTGSEVDHEEASPEPLPRVDFSTFVLSLATSALYHLGLAGDPETGETAAEPNLAVVKQTIDTLQMLEDKTRGNLQAEETRLLEGLLYELRMHFVNASKNADPAEPGAGPADETGS